VDEPRLCQDAVVAYLDELLVGDVGVVDIEQAAEPTNDMDS
jgi:hypothetical protein